MNSFSQRFRQEGRRQGMRQGEALALMRPMQRKFGAVPERARHRIETADTETLLEWLDRILTAWGEITLAPGDTATCQSNPCTVYLQMPVGAGTQEVTANEIKVGDFPAGKTVSLGGFFESNAIELPGTGLPPAYVYIPNVR